MGGHCFCPPTFQDPGGEHAPPFFGTLGGKFFVPPQKYGGAMILSSPPLWGGNVFPPWWGGRARHVKWNNTHNININVYHISMLYLGGLLG